MENLEDSTLLSLPASNATEQQTTPVANGAQQQASVPTSPLLGTDPLASAQLTSKPNYVNNPYGASSATYPMSYNYQQNYSQAGYPATQQAYSNIAMNLYGSSPSGTTGSYPHSSYPQSTLQQVGSTTAQSNASPSQLSSHAYNYAPYGGSSASYSQSNYPISSQYAQTSAHMNSHGALTNLCRNNNNNLLIKPLLANL